MGIKFSNNAQGVLTAGIGTGDTTNLTLTAGNGILFPTIVSGSGNYFYATLVSVAGVREIVKVTEHQAGTDVFQVFVRAQDDTVAAAFAIGDKIQLRFPKIIIEELQDDIAINAAAIAVNLAHNTASEHLLYAPSGLVFYIYNPVAEVPTGWSLHAGPADCLLAVAGGSNAYNVVGETLAGSWTPTGHTHTGPSHTHSGPSHTHTGPSHTHSGPSHAHSTPGHILSAAEMPSHSHNGGTAFYNNLSTGLYPYGAVSGGTYNVQDVIAQFGAGYLHTTGPAGSGGSHAHGNTGAGGTGATGASGTAATGASGTGLTGAQGTAATGTGKDPATDRPYAAVGFLIERD